MLYLDEMVCYPIVNRAQIPTITLSLNHDRITAVARPHGTDSWTLTCPILAEGCSQESRDACNQQV